MKIISLHNGHDASITALEDGKILFHWELERVLNKKHFCGIDYKNSPILDVLVDHCLPRLGWTLDDVDTIVLGGQTEWANTEFASIGHPMPSKVSNTEIKNAMYANDLNKPWGTFKATWRGKERTFYAVTHHVSHMALAYYTSPFTEALTFAYDGLGDYDTSTVYGVGRGNKLEYKGNFRHNTPAGFQNNGIGLAYSYLGRVFPFLGTDLLATAGKAMGLSSYGKPYPVDSPIWKACYEIITTWMPSPQHIFARISQHDISPQDCSDPMNEKCQNLMATFQDCLEVYLCNTIKRLAELEKINNLAIAGGCALNVQANSRLLNEKIVKKLYIPPACSDSGISLGAALYVWHSILDNPFSGVEFHDPYLGDTLYNHPDEFPAISLFEKWMKKEYPTITFKKIINESLLASNAAINLYNRKIIAWAQGRCEIGPRALGNRSILANPCHMDSKDIVNAKVKHREFWRPFAPIVIAQEAHDWFDIDHDQPYMLESPLALTDYADRIPAVVHVDGTCRVQSVSSKTNKSLFSVLKDFHMIKGIGVLLNTSLNGNGKPIANDLRDILNLLRDTELDVAYVGLWEFKKG